MSEDADSLEAAFGRVASEIRLDVLGVLWEIYTDDPTPEPEPVSFSTLRERVGVEDPGQFHYHLDRLVGQFVTRDEEGYRLTYAGARIVGAAHSGAYTGDTSLDERRVGACPTCGDTLRLRYEPGRVVLDCAGCAARQTTTAPPVLAEAHDADSDPALFGRFTMTQLQQTTRGFCYFCGGPVEGAIAGDGEAVRLEYECTECSAPFHTDAAAAVLDHPAVVALLFDAGIDYRELPSWEVPSVLDVETRLRSDPARLAVTVTVDGEGVELLVDDTLEVVDHGRIGD